MICMYIPSLADVATGWKEHLHACKIALCQNNVHMHQLQEYTSHAARKAVFRCKIFTLLQILHCSVRNTEMLVSHRSHIHLATCISASNFGCSSGYLDSRFWKANHFRNWARYQPSVADLGKCTSHRARFTTIEHWQPQAGPGGSSCI